MTGNDEQTAERHRLRMQRRQAVIAAKIAGASADRGVVVVHTGVGKGKSSAAFGMVCRALGHGMKVGVVQFIKNARATGEDLFFRRFPGEVSFHVMGEGFTWDTQDRARDVAAAERAWQQAQEFLCDATIGIVVLDELNIALKLGYLSLETVLAALETRPPMQHVVITGRGAPQELIDAADTVTDMGLVKHAFQAGVKAQKGVEL